MDKSARANAEKYRNSYAGIIGGEAGTLEGANAYLDNGLLILQRRNDGTMSFDADIAYAHSSLDVIAEVARSVGLPTEEIESFRQEVMKEG